MLSEEALTTIIGSWRLAGSGVLERLKYLIRITGNVLNFLCA
jgi:hypothetical protein